MKNQYDTVFPFYQRNKTVIEIYFNVSEFSFYTFLSAAAMLRTPRTSYWLKNYSNKIFNAPEERFIYLWNPDR